MPDDEDTPTDVDAAHAATYERIPIDAPDEWGDLASWSEKASRQQSWEAETMANTAALQEAIDWVREELGRHHGARFAKATVRLRTGGEKTFNAVSDDGSVVATVMNSGGATSGGKKPIGKIRGAIAEIYYLSLVDADRRLLVVTDGRFREILDRELAGRLVPEVQIVSSALPRDLAERVAGVTRSASDEMTR